MELLFAQLITGLANAGALFMVASGLSLIFGVTRIVNFAHGSFYMLGAYMGFTLMQILPGSFGFWSSIIAIFIASIFSSNLMRTLSSRMVDQISSKPSNSSVFYSVIWKEMA